MGERRATQEVRNKVPLRLGQPVPLMGNLCGCPVFESLCGCPCFGTYGRIWVGVLFSGPQQKK